MSTSVSGDTRDAKVAMRRVLRAARRDRPEDASAGAAIRDAALAWEPVARARVVACYASVGSEPDTRPLLDALHEAGVQVLLPVVLPDLDLDWAAHDPTTRMVSAVRGLEEPAGARLGIDAVRTADVVLVPGLAVSTTGQRLGQGGGCYDRALARVSPDVPVAVVLHPEEVGLDVPAEPHDRPVTHALTSGGVSVTPAP